ncbi:MAG: 4Fe-4S [Geobacteraceae bacterium]|nr:MAG: 4Fe-4S [Geobacteraceae bacterium]
MEQAIRAEIERYVQKSPDNRRPGGGEPYFEVPLVGFAAADDQIFARYKEIIGPFHLTPQELMESDFGNEARAATVISWVLPIGRTTRESNRKQETWPSREWAETRTFGEVFNVTLRRHMVGWLAEKGHLALAPQLSAKWREMGDTPVGIASTWSERHAAYAAGLGTFSLSDALITQRGIAHRLGSVITDLALFPSLRPAVDHRSNCLFFREGSCGMCIDRCPVGAISQEGHDKAKCRSYVYGTVPQAVGDMYGVAATGCGLCQTKVPCEAMIPPSEKGE